MSLKVEELDGDLIRIILIEDGIEKATLTGRFPPDSDSAILGIVYGHGKGSGRTVVKAFEREAQERGYSMVVLSSLEESRGFWEKLGYDEGIEEGIFEKDLPSIHRPNEPRRRPVKVKSHLRRRVARHLAHPPGACLCHRSRAVDRVRRGLARRLR